MFSMLSHSQIKKVLPGAPLSHPGPEHFLHREPERRAGGFLQELLHQDKHRGENLPGYNSVWSHRRQKSLPMFRRACHESYFPGDWRLTVYYWPCLRSTLKILNNWPCLRSTLVVFQTWWAWATCRFPSKASKFQDQSKKPIHCHQPHSPSCQVCVGRVPGNPEDVDLPACFCCFRFCQQKVCGGTTYPLPEPT